MHISFDSVDFAQMGGRGRGEAGLTGATAKRTVQCPKRAGPGSSVLAVSLQYKYYARCPNDSNLSSCRLAWSGHRCQSAERVLSGLPRGTLHLCHMAHMACHRTN